MAQTTQVVDIKAGIITGASFTGSPKTYAVTFDNAFPDNNYAITVTGSDGRAWASESVTASGFTINSQAATLIAGIVRWLAEYQGESL